MAAEPHAYVNTGGTATIAVNHAPINGVTALVIEKEFTETIVRGGVAGTKDLLSQASVTEIVSVAQGATTFAATADWLLDSDQVDWSPAGDEPATGSSYDVILGRLTKADAEEMKGGAAAGYDHVIGSIARYAHIVDGKVISRFNFFSGGWEVWNGEPINDARRRILLS